jgi:putative acetyltransferase
MAATLDEGRVIGSGAIRPLDEKLCELKRMWLLEPYQGKGIGYSIMQRLLDFARQIGYERIRLETGTGQARAISFYHRIGFQDVEDPELDDDDLMMEMAL